MSPSQLANAAKQFMQEIPPPKGQDPQNLIDSILLELED